MVAATEKSPLLSGSNHVSLEMEGVLELQSTPKGNQPKVSVQETPKKEAIEKTITKEEGKKLRELYLKATSQKNGSPDNFSDFVIEILPGIGTGTLKARPEKDKAKK